MEASRSGRIMKAVSFLWFLTTNGRTYWGQIRNDACFVKRSGMCYIDWISAKTGKRPEFQNLVENNGKVISVAESVPTEGYGGKIRTRAGGWYDDRADRETRTGERRITSPACRWDKEITFAKPQVKVFLHALKLEDVNVENARRGFIALTFNGGGRPIPLTMSCPMR